MAISNHPSKGVPVADPEEGPGGPLNPPHPFRRNWSPKGWKFFLRPPSPRNFRVWMSPPPNHIWQPGSATGSLGLLYVSLTFLFISWSNFPERLSLLAEKLFDAKCKIHNVTTAEVSKMGPGWIIFLITQVNLISSDRALERKYCITFKNRFPFP